MSITSKIVRIRVNLHPRLNTINTNSEQVSWEKAEKECNKSIVKKNRNSEWQKRNHNQNLQILRSRALLLRSRGATSGFCDLVSAAWSSLPAQAPSSYPRWPSVRVRYAPRRLQSRRFGLRLLGVHCSACEFALRVVLALWLGALSRCCWWVLYQTCVCQQFVSL